MIAIRTPRIVRIGINSGHCEEQSRIAAWKLHKSIYKIRGTYQENKDTFITKSVAGAIAQAEAAQKAREGTSGQSSREENETWTQRDWRRWK